MHLKYYLIFSIAVVLLFTARNPCVFHSIGLAMTVDYKYHSIKKNYIHLYNRHEKLAKTQCTHFETITLVF